MRLAILATALLVLGACAQPAAPDKSAANKLDYDRFLVPTNGAAYSQSDMYYYRDNANPGAAGPSGVQIRVK